MQKYISFDGLTYPILVSRRKGARSLRIAIKSDGQVRLTIPYGVPEFIAKKFVQSKLDWIEEHRQVNEVLKDHDHIGKNHTLHILRTDSSRSHSKITATAIIVHVPEKLDLSEVAAQEIIAKACEKALLQESENLLPQRLESLASKHSIEYTSCQIKKLKSRWGACDNLNNITLNSFLIQLDWKLIDYVLLHELAHTKYHHHQAAFWEYLSTIFPEYKDIRKELKLKKTAILPTDHFT
jgi:predicted metal-dependent hydrolase